MNPGSGKEPPPTWLSFEFKAAAMCKVRRVASDEPSEKVEEEEEIVPFCQPVLVPWLAKVLRRSRQTR